MDKKATATLRDNSKISGRLTTDHAASSYGQPVFVGDNGQAYNWADIVDVDTATDMRSKGGSATTEAKKSSSANNGKLGGRPKKAK